MYGSNVIGNNVNIQKTSVAQKSPVENIHVERLTEQKTSLRVIAERQGTDKGVYHKFATFYGECLEKRKNDIKLVVEMGVAQGKSLAMWREYFPLARVVGLDIEPKQIEDTYVCDGGNADSILQALRSADIPEKSIDLFIDDGGHFMDQQQITWQTVWPYLAPKAFFIMEDLHTSLLQNNGNQPNWDFNPEKIPTTLDIVFDMLFAKTRPPVYTQFEDIAKRVDTISLFTHFHNDPVDTSMTAVLQLQ